METPVPVEELTYGKALAEIESILREMQSDACDIDRLTANTRRAAALIEECRRRLTVTDKELQAILESLNS